MRRSECLREADVLEALQSSRWPEGCPAELREHVARCLSCGELVEIVAALLDDQHRAVAQAPVPTAGVVWWRAQMRARQEAARAATRPITIVQGLALACAAGLLAAVAGFVSPEFRAWIAWAWGAAGSIEVPALALPAVLQSESFLNNAAGFATLGGLMLLVMIPLALYLTLTE